MEKHTVMEKHTTIMGFRVSALIEMFIFFVVLLAIDVFWGDQNRFADNQLHPCWIIILAMSVVYGTAEGLLAVLVSIVFLLLGNMPEQSFDQDTYAYLYTVSKLPIIWIIVALFIGEWVRRKQIIVRSQLLKELAIAHDREEKIVDSYEDVKEHKQRLELRIAGQLRSTVDTYRAAKAIEKLDPQDVLSGVRELVKAVLNPEKFSIFLRDNGSISTTIISGWAANDEYSRSFDGGSSLFRRVVGEKELLCAVNEDQEQALFGEGVIAGPLVNVDSGEVIGMLKIEKMPFSELNLTTIETFRAICEWVALAFVNADKYQAMKSDSVVNPDHNLMTAGYFKRHMDYISALAKRLNFDVSMIVVKLLDADKLDPTSRAKVAKQLSTIVDSVLRSVDLAFDYQEGVGEFSIVLPATNKKGAKIVQEKIEKGLASKARWLSNSSFAFTVHSIHEK